MTGLTSAVSQACLQLHSCSLQKSEEKNKNKTEKMAHKVNKADIPPLLGDAGVFRVVIHGNSGTGKSTLASRLGPILNVPVLHLDKIYWRPNWVGAPTEEVTAEVQNFIDDSARKNIGWVIDGNYESVVKGIADSAATDIICTLSLLCCRSPPAG